MTTFQKQAPFSMKTTDLPDVPSPTYTAAQIKNYIQNPSDELMTTLNNVVDGLNGSGWVDNSRLADGSVSTSKLDPAILAQPTTTTEVQAKLQQHDEELAENLKHRTEWINVKQPPYNAPTNGVDDDSIAIQKAIDDVLDGGVVYIPKQLNSFLLKTPIIKDNKSFTLIIEGTLKDNITSFTENYLDTTLSGKGLLAFGHGEIKIIGSNQNAFDGNRGTAAYKNFLYLFECNGVQIEGVNGSNFAGNCVIGIGCTNVTHKNCVYDGGNYTVLWSRTNNIVIENVTVNNSLNNGITVHDRGFFDSTVYLYSRPKKVKVVNNTVFNTYIVNAYAVGITVDSCDHIQVSGNFVDGNNKSTMAYSFAGSVGGQIFGNRAINVSTTSNGTETYTGLGMEFDGCQDIQSFGNTFNNVLIGHIIANCQNCKFDAVMSSTLTGASGAGQSSLYQLSNTTSLSKDIELNGIVNGGDRGISGNINVDGLTIGKLVIRNANSKAVALYGGNVKNFSINDITILFDGQSQQGIILSDGVVNDISVNRFKIKATTIQTGKQAFYGSKSGGKFFLRHGYIENYDIGIQANLATQNQIVLNDIDYVNVTTIEQLLSTNTSRTNIRNNGVAA